MTMEQNTLQLSTILAAWYGAVIATVGLLCSIYNIRRDRAQIKIAYKTNMYIHGGDVLNYQTGVKYIAIDVINTGRRPIKIEKACLLVAGEPNLSILTDSFAPHRPKVITEEAPTTTFLAKQDLVDLSNVYGVLVVDGAGKKYKKYTSLFPTLIRIRVWLARLKKK